MRWNMFNHYQLNEGIDLYVRSTNQFKTVTLLAEWETEYTAEKAAHRAVLSNVLQDSSQQYPTYTAFKNKLDELYGTTFVTDITKRENRHRFVLLSETVNEKWVHTDDLFEQWFSFMHQALHEPNLTIDGFDSATVRREKRSIDERIRAIYDDKDRYALRQLLQTMRPNDVASASVLGNLEAVEKITASSLVDEYKRMLKEDPIKIYVVGQVDEAYFVEKLQQIFDFGERKKIAPYEVPTSQEKAAFEEVETQQTKQSKLLLGYHTPITMRDDRFPIMQIANGILGGFAHSKLFQNVREKESMAYTVHSSYLSQYGMLLVSAGIDGELSEKATRLINEQIQAMIEGDITALELNQTVALMRHSVRNAWDTPRGQIVLFDQYKDDNHEMNMDAIIQRWANVTAKDIQEAMQTVVKEGSFLLKGVLVDDGNNSTDLN